jgi:hypothetical protein
MQHEAGKFIIPTIDAIRVLRKSELSRMVHRRNLRPYQDRTRLSMQTAVKMRLIFSQLVTFYLESADVVLPS